MRKTSENQPDSYDLRQLIASNTTHFTEDELCQLYQSFKRVARDGRIQGTQFFDLIVNEMGWSSLVLRKQYFAAFDVHHQNSLDFATFATGYSTLLRGTVPELLDFAFRLYKIQDKPNKDSVMVSDLYTVLCLGLAGLPVARRVQNRLTGGEDETRFPERTARLLLKRAFGDAALVTKRSFQRGILRHRKMIHLFLPGFTRVPIDPLHAAVRAGDHVELERLLDLEQFDVDGSDALQSPTTPLHLACEQGDVTIVRILLSRNANPRIQRSEDGETAMGVAILQNHHDVLDVMMTLLAQARGLQEDPFFTMVNARGESLLHVAARAGNTRALQKLLPHFQHVSSIMEIKDHDNETPLHAAASVNHALALDVFTESAKLFLPPVSRELDQGGRMGRTPLHAAAEAGAVQTLQRLLDLGADPSRVDRLHRTVLFAAASCALTTAASDDMVERLFRDGRAAKAGGWSVRDVHGCTALHAAVQQKNLRVTRLLLQAGVDPNLAAHTTLRTPLHNAVLLHWIEGVEALLAPGMETRLLRDKDGYTPYDYARQPEISEMLREYIERTYPDASSFHPVCFDYALVLHDGVWKRYEPAGAKDPLVAAMHDDEAVPRRLERAKKASERDSRLLDAPYLWDALRRAGLFVHEEIVLRSRGGWWLWWGGVDQRRVWRIGAPLYRLQQQAARMRLVMRRRFMDGSVGKVGEFYLDDALFPDSPFEKFSRAERERLVYHMLTASNQHVSDKDAFTLGANVDLALYLGKRGVESFFSLHAPGEREGLLAAWKWSLFWPLGAGAAKRRREGLQRIRDYFGDRYAFHAVFGLYAFGSLLIPALAGAVCFGLLFLPRDSHQPLRFSLLASSPLFRPLYDHPILFAHSGIVMLWSMFFTSGWAWKEGHVRNAWGMKEEDCAQTRLDPPNPHHSATQPKKWARLLLLRLPILLALFGASLGSQYVCIRLIDWHHATPTLFLDEARTRLTPLGQLAWYSVFATSGALVWFWNKVGGAVVAAQSAAERHETLGAQRSALLVQLVPLLLVNTLSPLFYFIYWVRNLEYAAYLLGAILVVSFVFNVVYHLVWPLLLRRGARRLFEHVEDPLSPSSPAPLSSPPRPKRTRLGKAGKVEPSPTHLQYWVEKGAQAPLVIRTAGKALLTVDPSAIPTSTSSTLAIMTDAALPDGVEEDKMESRDFRHYSEIRTELWHQVRGGGNEQGDAVLDLAERVVMLCLLALVGGIWPLSSVVLCLSMLVHVKRDVWRYALVFRRPMAERSWGGVGAGWMALLHLATVLGITNHAFMLFFIAETPRVYFYPEQEQQETLSRVSRACMALSMQAGSVALLLLLKSLLRMRKGHPHPRALVRAPPQTLTTRPQYVCEAYFLGWQLRSDRFHALLAPVATDPPLATLAAELGLDTLDASRCLLLTRYLASLSSSQRTELLRDSSATMVGLLARLERLQASGQYHDDGEPPTVEALALGLVTSSMDLKRAYLLGKRYLEACFYEMTVRNRDVESSERLACIDLDLTPFYAMHCVQFVQCIDALPGNPFVSLATLQKSATEGMIQVLRAIQGEKGFTPPPPITSLAHLGRLIEPLAFAREAYTRAAVVRLKMFSQWVRNRHLQHDELLDRALEELGGVREQGTRYLLLRRYMDDLPMHTKLAVLDKGMTLDLVQDIISLQKEGAWCDGGEKPFREYSPRDEELMVEAAEEDVSFPFRQTGALDRRGGER